MSSQYLYHVLLFLLVNSMYILHRVEGVKICLQSSRVLFSVVFWVVKVEQVWLVNAFFSLKISTSFFTLLICTLLGIECCTVTFGLAISINCGFILNFSGAGIDLSSLVVVEGKVCWDLYIDGLVISSDGNLLDALGAAIKVLLLSYRVALSSRRSKYPNGMPWLLVKTGDDL